MFRNFLDGLDRITGRVSVGDSSADSDTVVHVESAQYLRSIYFGEFDELADRGHFTVLHPHIDVVERFGVESVFRIGLDHYAVNFREAVDVRNVLSAVIARKSRKDVRRRDARTFGLRCIDVHHILREIDVEGRIGHLDFRPLVERVDVLQVDVVEVRDVTACTVLQVHFETGRSTVAGDHRGGYCEDLRILDVGGPGIDLADHGIHGIGFVGTLRPVFQFDDTHTVGVTLPGDHTVTGYLLEVADLGNPLQSLAYLSHDFVGFGERAARSRRYVDHDRTLVLVGHQTGFCAVHQQNQADHCQTQRCPSEPFMFDEEHDAALVFLEHGTESRIVSLAEPGREVVLHVAVFIDVWLEQQGAERRGKSQCVECGDTDGNGHRDTELRIERTRGSAHHRHRDKHGHKDQRRGDDGRSDAAHGIDRSQVR